MIDWLALARRLQDIQTQMIHNPSPGDPQRHGEEFYAEALRRTFGYQRQDGTDGRELPYDTVTPSTGLVTAAEADYLRESHTIVDRLGRATAENKIRDLQAENRRLVQDAARDLGRSLRAWCNDRTVPGKYRQEGVLIAADRLDPTGGQGRYSGG